MLNIGLKIWSTNLYYIPIVKDLYARKIFEYIELFIVPGSSSHLGYWSSLGIPYILHAPHSYAGLNMADKARREENHQLVSQVNIYFKDLNPQWVIFHPGILFDINEAISQINSFKKDFPRLMAKSVIENKPAIGLNGENCVGSSAIEIKKVIASTGLGFCFDIGHAICAAASEKRPWKEVLEEFFLLDPDMYHLSDSHYGEKDMHLHLGAGQFDLDYIIKRLPANATISLETPKDSKENLDDFKKDTEFLKEYATK